MSGAISEGTSDEVLKEPATMLYPFLSLPRGLPLATRA